MNSAFNEFVVCLVLFRFAEKLPPCHGTCCCKLPLNWTVLAEIVAPVVEAPEIVLLEADFVVCVLTSEFSVGLYTERRLASVTS